MTPDVGERPQWDNQAAQSLLGKTVIIGLTYVDQDDNVLNQEQRHGTIVQVDEQSGFGIETGDEAEPYWLPPHLDAFGPAEPGEYRLRSTGEVIVDPDLLSNWTIVAADSDSEPETPDRGYVPPE
jgi:hypothetical protein